MRNFAVKARIVVFMLVFVTCIYPVFAQSDTPTPIEEAFSPLVLGDNVFSMLYPSAWILDENTQEAIVLASQEELFDFAPETEFAEGDVWVSLSLIPTGSGFNPDNTLMMTFANYLTNTLLTELDGETPPELFPSLPEILPSTESGVEIARLLITYGDYADVAVYFWQLTDRVYGVLNVVSAAGEIETHATNAIIMIQSTSLSEEYVTEFLAANADQ